MGALLVNLEDPKVGKHEFSSLLTIYYFSAMASSSPSEKKQISDIHIL